MATKRDLLDNLSYDYIRRFVIKTRIISPGQYRDKKDHVRGLVRQLSSEECGFLKQLYDEGVPARRAAERFTRIYQPDDELVRKEFLQKLRSEHGTPTVLSEIPVKDNRADLVQVGEDSTAYELKSPRDTYRRLESQLSAFHSTFDKVYVVIPANENVPEAVMKTTGVIQYTYPEFEFEYTKEANPTDSDLAVQLRQLWLRDLRTWVSSETAAACADAEDEQSELIDAILEKYSSTEIERRFRQSLANRVLEDDGAQPEQSTLTI